jgi:predicted nucleotide-binding protein (sugar kinase/HSP70/actin superfamily)
VRAREQLIFKTNTFFPFSESAKQRRKTIGINKSFLVNSLFPFYRTFFEQLGFDIILPGNPSNAGFDYKNAAFCYPADLAHGFFHALTDSNRTLDYIFLPHIQSIPIENGHSNAQACPFVQGEPFYLKTAFKTILERLQRQGTNILTPFIDMRNGLDSAEKTMIQIALKMGISRNQAIAAFHQAVSEQLECNKQMKSWGKRVLKELESDSEKIAIVMFGRPYNAMVGEAHMGIPHKFASRGIQIIPFDFLPFENERSKKHMYWGMGQIILKAARFVEKHPQLFATYVTNFSCGPDSFLITYFRSIMGRKPSLTLELDSHTADAGLETRIEAYLDIISEYRQIHIHQMHINQKNAAKINKFVLARTFMDNGFPGVQTSAGAKLSMNDPNVTLLFPSMGELSTRALSTVFSKAGYHVPPIVPADESTLKLGRANTSCKECLPLILTTGTLLDYVYNKKQSSEILVYFMPSASGPCRFGQYSIFMEDLIKRLELTDVAVFSLTSDSTYATMGKGFSNQKAWCAIVIADIMEDLYSLLLANAQNKDVALLLFNNAFESILHALIKGNFNDLSQELGYQMKKISDIPFKRPHDQVPKILLTGEIFVRKDGFSRQKLTEQLAAAGFAVVCSPTSEWFRYSDYLQCANGSWSSMSVLKKINFTLRQIFMNRYEKKLTSIFSSANMIDAKPVNLKKIMRSASPFISEQLTGEAILTIGSAISEVATEVCGVIAIGPFGCMPNRISEAILSEAMTREVKLSGCGSENNLEKILATMDDLPFLAIESDGSPFPQLIEAKLEAFCQQSRRLHDQMINFH